MHADRVPSWTMKQSSFISWWDPWSSASLDSSTGTGCYNLLSVFAILYTPHMPKFYMATCGNHRNNSRTALISLFFKRLSTPGKPGFAAALFLVRLTTASQHHVVTRGIRSLFHILTTNFVHVGPISMLTNRPWHGLWTANESGRFRSISFTVSKPNVVSGGPEYQAENIGINS